MTNENNKKELNPPISNREEQRGGTPLLPGASGNDFVVLEENLRAISKLCLFDDDLMTLVFDRNIEATELMLNIILGRKDLKVLEVVAQREYRSPVNGGRSVTFDVYAKDGDGKVYDIEVQHASSGADAHRARFHSSMMDSKMLQKNQKFTQLSDSYVIFITRWDVMKGKLPLYHVERTVTETKKPFGDGSHIIYVNGSYRNNEDSIGKLMHDFRCRKADDMFYEPLARQVRHYKETGGGQRKMSRVIEELVEKRSEKRAMELAGKLAEELAEKLAEERAGKMAAEMMEKAAGERTEKMTQNAIDMLADGKLTVKEIVRYTDLPLETVEGLAQAQRGNG